jgi:hypothetical protein
MASDSTPSAVVERFGRLIPPRQYPALLKRDDFVRAPYSDVAAARAHSYVGYRRDENEPIFLSPHLPAGVDELRLDLDTIEAGFIFLDLARNSVADAARAINLMGWALFREVARPPVVPVTTLSANAQNPDDGRTLTYTMERTGVGDDKAYGALVQRLAVAVNRAWWKDQLA